MTNQRIGTLIYMAPEVIFEQSYTSKCDVYSLGITLCEMYTRRRPYEGMKKEGTLMGKIHKDGLRPVIDDGEVDEYIRSIIKRYSGTQKFRDVGIFSFFNHNFSLLHIWI